ncbi:hypothetical protein [Nonomuraea diastatica]|uniref:Uncharacterized protein n=1 Tax=Nonomuraea diastatica TaxID=1848329 RepID=A0A4R4WUK1_9ACTN|nr:hypothetical protein [Nonomuraea diastatica]TDD21331.1 hypothetical protein E1294_15230 [Nonomuraea diastatica]
MSLPVIAVAAQASPLASEVRTAATVLAVAAIINTLAWLPVAAMMLPGLTRASWTFAAAVTMSAVVSSCMAGLAARLALRQGRAAVGRLTPA